MVKKHEVSNQAASSAKLTLTVDKKDVKATYDGLIGKYAKTAVLPGFRKGHVPPAVLERKYGEGLKAEALQDILEKSLQEVLETLEQKPLNFAPPRLVEEDLKLDFEADLTFSLVYDVYPLVNVKDYKGVEIEEPQVTISAKDEEAELDQLREQNALVIDKNGRASRGDVVTFDSVELDEAGQAVEASRRAGFSFTLGTGANLYDLDEDLQGTEKGQELKLTKTYAGDYKYAELAGTTKTLSVKVTAVKEKKLPDLDDDFAQDVNESYKTLADLKAALKKKLEDRLEAKLREVKLNALLEKLAASTPFDIPASMLEAELENSWGNVASQNRMNPDQLAQIFGSEAKKSMLDGWRPAAEKSLRHRLILNKIMELEKVEPSEADTDAELARLAERRRSTLAETKAQYQQNGLMEYVVQDLKDKMTVDLLLAGAKLKKGKKTDFKSFIDQAE